MNFFQPSKKLRSKRREGAKVEPDVRRCADPYQCLLAAAFVEPGDAERLATFYQALDPVRLMHQPERLQDAF